LDSFPSIYDSLPDVFVCSEEIHISSTGTVAQNQDADRASDNKDLDWQVLTNAELLLKVVRSLGILVRRRSKNMDV
jgi:hypothetical protein